MRAISNILWFCAAMTLLGGGFFGAFVLFGLGCWARARHIEHRTRQEAGRFHDYPSV